MDTDTRRLAAVDRAITLYAETDWQDDAEILQAADRIAKFVESGTVPAAETEPAEAAAPDVLILRTDSGPRTIAVVVAGETVAATDYDEVGWSGMDAMERVATAVAEACGATVRREEPTT